MQNRECNKALRRAFLETVALGVCVLTWLARIADIRAAEIRFADDVAVIRTDRYEVAWRNGSLMGLRSFLPREQQVTVDGRPMQAADLPNGLAVVAQRSPELLRPYGVVASFPLTATYPAYHPPLSGQTKVTCERIENGVRLTYRGLAGESQGVLVQELVVEPGTGDLIIRQQGEGPQGGVTGIAFGVLNLRREVTLIAPYFGGQRWTADYSPGVVASWVWPYMWNAGLMIGELPEGGSFSVWAEDPDLRPKFFRRRNSPDALGLGFESCAEAPFDGQKLTVPAWRFNTFAGSWIEPAQRYKDWRATAFHLTPRAQRPSRWVDDIALVVPDSPSEAGIQQLGQVIDPKHLLFMDWGWLQGFNRRIPDYVAQGKDFAERIAMAHRHGARVGVYTSLALVDQETHPAMMKEYGLEYFFRGPAQERPAGVAKGWLQYVHPGSARWREFYSRKMAEIAGRYGIDYLYQDVTGCGAGSAGLVEGLTFSKAVVACEEAIRAAVPQAALGGEFWTDVNGCQEDFAVHGFQAWFGPAHAEFITRPRQPHPILSFLFSDYCVSWPHQVSIRDTVKFHRDQNINEVTGAIPVWTTTPDDRAGEARAVLERARLFAEGFRPYFPKDWEPDVVSYLRDGRGHVVKYVRPHESTFCYETSPQDQPKADSLSASLAPELRGEGRGEGPAARLRYARITGLNRLSLSEPVTIDGWIAYDAAGPIGLNPAGWYCAFPGSPPKLPVTITRLPEGAWLAALRRTDDYVLAEIGGQGAAELAWRLGDAKLELVEPAGCDAQRGACRLTLPATLLFRVGEPLAVVPGERLHLDQWQHNVVANGQIIRPGKLLRHGNYQRDGQTVVGSMVHPPTGGKDSEISLDRLVRLPSDPTVALRVALGRLGGSGDGVHFVVRVNGREIWRRFSPAARAWTDVAIPLRDYAGRTSVLSLALDCGPSGFNTSCDEAIWAEPRIAVGASAD
jgi:hypothetical protein